MDLASNPFLVGSIQGGMEETKKIEEKQAAALEKERTNLVTQFDKDVNSVKDLMSKVKDPKQREVVAKIVEQMKTAYPEAGKKFGLDGAFARQLDLATQMPYDVKNNEYNTNSGSLPELLQLQNALNDPSLTTDQKRAIQDRIYTKSTGQSPPDSISAAATSRYAGKEMGVDYAAISKLAMDAPVNLEILNSTENAIKSLGDLGQGPIVGQRPKMLQGEEAQKISGESVKGALQFVQQTKGAISDKEMALFKDASVGITNDMSINLDRIAAAKGILARVSQQSAFFTEWKKLHGGLDGAYEAFKQYAAENPIFKKSKNGFLLQLNKPAEEIASDTSWQKYLNYGVSTQPDQSNNEVLPPMPPVNMDANGEMSGGMMAPQNNNDPLGIR